MIQNKQMILIGVIILVVITIFMQQGQEGTKLAGPGLTATRAWTGGVGPKHVLPGQTITATYTPATLNYFAIIEPVPSGWTPDKTVSTDNKVRTTADGTGITIVWTAPLIIGPYTFTGQYFVNPDVTYTSFPQQVVTVGTGATNATGNTFGIWIVAVIIGLIIIINKWK